MKKKFSTYVAVISVMGLTFVAGNVQMQSLQTSFEVPLGPQGIDMRFSNLTAPTITGPGYVLFESLRPLEGSFSNWSITSYTTYTNHRNATGETGVAVLDVIPEYGSSGPAYSDVVGIMRVPKTISEMNAPSLDAGFIAPVDGTAEFRHGRLLIGFGDESPANIGYKVSPGSSLVLDDFDLVTDDSTASIAALELMSTQRGLGLTGVFTDGQDPVYAFHFTTQDANNNGVADPIDPDKIWYEAAPLLQGSWRPTDLSPNVVTGLGMLMEEHWPWVYSYRLDGGKWIYIHDKGDDPTSFWAYHEDRYWMFMHLATGKWYYHWINKEWVEW